MDLKILHPELITETRQLLGGSASHEQLAADAVPISHEELKAKLESGQRLLLRESIFQGAYKKIPVVGKPDLVEVEGFKALLLVDYKFSRRREPFRDHLVQLALYGFLLHAEKFDTTELATIVSFLPQPPAPKGWAGASLDPRIEEQLVETCRRLRAVVVRSRRPSSEATEQFACFAYPFALAEARKYLSEVEDFWAGKREPEPTRHEKKCVVCEFNAAGLCEVARAKPDPSFVVERSQEGLRVLLPKRRI